MKYKRSPKFKKAWEIENDLAIRVEKLSALLASQVEREPKISIINQLYLAIHKYDDHLKQIIMDFPDYYNDNKPNTDKVLVENVKFIRSISSEMAKIDPYLIN